MKHLGKAVAAVALSAVALAGCGGGGDPLAKDTEGADKQPAKDDAAVVVGGANFTESKLLAEIYAGALRAEGVEAETKPDIGSREAYLGALKDGSVHIFPEYTGNLAVYYDENASASSAQGWYSELQKSLPDHLVALEMSSAQNNDSVTVTKETAQKHDLQTISDLQPVADQLVFGGPPEMLTRDRGVKALEQTYGLEFEGEFKRLQGSLASQALVNGQVDAANIFTTDPSIFANDFVVLKDDKGVFPTNNVVPIVRKDRADPKIEKALDAVSAKLDTATLSELDKQVDIDKKQPAEVADAWLKQNGLA